MSVSEFVKYWIESSARDNADGSYNGLNSTSVLYLKDWHFVKVLFQNISSFVKCLFDGVCNVRTDMTGTRNIHGESHLNKLQLLL